MAKSNPVLSEDEVLVLRTLVGEGVRLVVVGGWAVQYHGHKRTREDLDLLIEKSSGNIDRLRRALILLRSDFPDLGEYHRLCGDRKIKFQVGYYPVEIVTAIDGLAFPGAWTDADCVTLQGLQIRVISKQHLIANKLATRRPKDMEDLSALQGSD